jgi:methionine synthase (B12-dependent) (EC 2.1.1.13)
MTYAEEQVARGADLLDVNVGAPMVEEARMLPLAVQALTSAHSIPLCLDSSDISAIRAGLEAYPGSALVNSISGEEERMDILGPLCRDYGAPFILLPLKGRKLPVTATERLAIIEELLRKAEDLRIPRRLILVDALALTVSSKPEAAKACLDVIRHCRERWGLGSTMGLSNISFGLPARDLINSTFLTMAMGAGMTSFIANPNAVRIRESLAAAEVLLGRDKQASGSSPHMPDGLRAATRSRSPQAWSKKRAAPWRWPCSRGRRTALSASSASASRPAKTPLFLWTAR